MAHEVVRVVDDRDLLELDLLRAQALDQVDGLAELDVAVIVAVIAAKPSFSGVTSPVFETVATAGSLDVHVTATGVPSTVAENWTGGSPSSMPKNDGLTSRWPPSSVAVYPRS